MFKRVFLLVVGLGSICFGGVRAVAAVELLDTEADHTVHLPTIMGAGDAYLWISPSEVAALPTAGSAWSSVLSWAQEDSSQPQLSNQDDQTDTVVLAKALAYLRTGNQTYRNQVIAAIDAVMGTEQGGRTLALGRNLTAYVLAADLVGLPPELEAQFRSWLAAVRHKVLDGLTLIETHEKRPNNWGTHAGAARIAVALYLGDSADLQRAISVFRGWLGDRSAYAGFNFNSDLSWHCNPAQPVPVNPAGCTIAGHVVDGVLPDDQRRSGSFAWPPPKENYVWEALQGAAAQARLLSRAGYPAFEWQDRALLRAVTWLHQQANFPAAGDDTGTPWLINAVYGGSFPTVSPARPGKNGLGFYDWLGK